MNDNEPDDNKPDHTLGGFMADLGQRIRVNRERHEPLSEPFCDQYTAAAKAAKAGEEWWQSAAEVTQEAFASLPEVERRKLLSVTVKDAPPLGEINYTPAIPDAIDDGTGTATGYTKNHLFNFQLRIVDATKGVDLTTVSPVLALMRGLSDTATLALAMNLEEAWTLLALAYGVYRRHASQEVRDLIEPKGKEG